MRIGTIQLKAPFILAPMAGFTDLAFRLLAKRCGCGLVFTEMVSAHGLVQGHARTLRYVRSDPEERPLAVQLFGSRPEILAQAASRVLELGADIIDLNMGCPVRKVTKGGSGAALLTDLKPDRAHYSHGSAGGGLPPYRKDARRVGFEPPDVSGGGTYSRARGGGRVHSASSNRSRAVRRRRGLVYDRTSKAGNRHTGYRKRRRPDAASGPGDGCGKPDVTP